jgi:hypothetical protein
MSQTVRPHPSAGRWVSTCLCQIPIYYVLGDFGIEDLFVFSLRSHSQFGYGFDSKSLGIPPRLFVRVQPSDANLRNIVRESTVCGFPSRDRYAGVACWGPLSNSNGLSSAVVTSLIAAGRFGPLG